MLTTKTIKSGPVANHSISGWYYPQECRFRSRRLRWTVSGSVTQSSLGSRQLVLVCSPQIRCQFQSRCVPAILFEESSDCSWDREWLCARSSRQRNKAVAVLGGNPSVPPSPTVVCAPPSEASKLAVAAAAAQCENAGT